MTNRFVPTEPGLYWATIHGRCEILKVYVLQGGGLRAGRIGNGWFDIDDITLNWIAPITPPDVVDEMREALVPFAEHAEQYTDRFTDNTCLLVRLSDLRRARAVLAKIGKVGG